VRCAVRCPRYTKARCRDRSLDRSHHCQREWAPSSRLRWCAPANREPRGPTRAAGEVELPQHRAQAERLRAPDRAARDAAGPRRPTAPIRQCFYAAHERGSDPCPPPGSDAAPTSASLKTTKTPALAEVFVFSQWRRRALNPRREMGRIDWLTPKIGNSASRFRRSTSPRFRGVPSRAAESGQDGVTVVRLRGGLTASTPHPVAGPRRAAPW